MYFEAIVMKSVVLAYKQTYGPIHSWSIDLQQKLHDTQCGKESLE
jgi:hypothetical protein